MFSRHPRVKKAVVRIRGARSASGESYTGERACNCRIKILI